jgi:hypothetical protein
MMTKPAGLCCIIGCITQGAVQGGGGSPSPAMSLQGAGEGGDGLGWNAASPAYGAHRLRLLALAELFALMEPSSLYLHWNAGSELYQTATPRPTISSYLHSTSTTSLPHLRHQTTRPPHRAGERGGEGEHLLLDGLLQGRLLPARRLRQRRSRLRPRDASGSRRPARRCAGADSDGLGRTEMDGEDPVRERLLGYCDDGLGWTRMDSNGEGSATMPSHAKPCPPIPSHGAPGTMPSHTMVGWAVWLGMVWLGMAQPYRAMAQPYRAMAQPCRAMAQPYRAMARPYRAMAQPYRAMVRPGPT